MYRRFFLVYAVGLLLALVSSCENTSVEEDADRYCKCVQKHGTTNNAECIELQEALTKKYEFDPVAAEEFSREIQKCSIK